MPSLLPGSGTVTYPGKLAMDVLLRPAMVMGRLEDYFKVVTGVKQRQQVVFINPLNYLTKTDPGCGLGVSPSTVTRSEKFWTPDPMKAWVQQCYFDLSGTVYEQDLRSGDERSNLQGTLAEEHMLAVLEPAIDRDIKRIAYLGKKTIIAAELTAGAPRVSDYSQTDGIMTKIIAAVGAGLTPRITITENAAAAGAQSVAPAAALSYLQRTWYNARPVLKAISAADKRLYVTRGIYEGYEQYLTSLGTLESSFSKLQDGSISLTFMGVPLQILDIVDQFLLSDFTLAGKTTNPNWVIYAAKDVLQIAIDSPTTEPMALRMWEDLTTEQYNARIKYLMATQIALEEYVSVAF